MVVLIALLANPEPLFTLNVSQSLSTTVVDEAETRPVRTKQRQVRLTKLEIGELVKARASGTTINALAAEFGIHRTTVMGHLKRDKTI